jgi:predicted DNA repair protein MutK
MKAMMRLRTIWTSPIRLIVMVLVGIAILAAAFVTLAVVLPLLLIGGIILHFYVRRQLRKVQPRSQSSDRVIDVEYTVVDRP